MYFSNLYPKINFVFSKNYKNFIVEEIPLYAFSNNGEHRILKIRKKDITTFELIDLIAKKININKKEIGYAGLKDKHSLSYQFISLPKKYDIKEIQNIENIKIMDETYHNNKIKIGHLSGNKFFVIVKKINPFDFGRLECEMKKALQQGFPNYFGIQRFGNLSDNYKLAPKNKPIKKQTKMDKFYISSLQSHLFNKWLETRMHISNIIVGFNANEIKEILIQKYALNVDINTIKMLKDSNLLLCPLDGDVCKHYPHGRLFHIENMQSEIKRLSNFDIAITGLLCGQNNITQKDNGEFNVANISQNANKNFLSQSSALIIEKNFMENINALGSRRYALVRPSDLNIIYKKHEAQAHISFTLPSGSYATTFLQYVKNDEL